MFHRLGAEGIEPPAADAPVYAPDYSGDADDPEPAPAGTQLGSTPEAIARRLAARAARTQKGLLIVYTGQGKGKTTAALGVMLRAWGREMRVGGVQFFKHANATFDELRALAKMQVELTPMGMVLPGRAATWTSRRPKRSTGGSWPSSASPAARSIFSCWTSSPICCTSAGWRPPRCSRGSRPISRPCCT
jgi:hypothetical protein